MSSSAIETYKQLLRYEVSNDISAEAEPYFRFHLFESGSGNLELNERVYSVISPCMLCLSERHAAKFTSGPENARIHTVRFKPALINPAFDFNYLRKGLEELENTQGLDIYWLYPFLESKTLHLMGPTTAARLTELLNSMAEELTEQRGDFWPCRSRSYFYELLNAISHIHSRPEHMEPAAASDMDQDLLNITSYLNANYHLKIALSDLTELFAVNRTTLSEKFRKVMGMTVMTYLAAIRIRMACLLLRDTTLPIQEIMERVGYEDTTHFARVFRGQTGKTPSKYREEHGQALSLPMND